MPNIFKVSAFADAIREHRKDRSLREIADETGCSASTLSRLERGNIDNISISRFLAICDWLGIPPTEFFGLNTYGLLTRVENLEGMLTLLNSLELEIEANANHLRSVSDKLDILWDAVRAKVQIK